MVDLLTALGLGAAVGLGVAVPLGAIGVLLLQTGMIHGWRTAAAGGLGAALVDLGYAIAAVLAGTVVSMLLAEHVRQVELIGAAVLAGVAVAGLSRALRRPNPSIAPATVPLGRHRPAGSAPDLPFRRLPAADSDGKADLEVGGSLTTPGRTLVRFVLLTAVNPMTVVYFTVVAAGLADRLSGPADRVAFVVGIGAASAAWQLGLAAAGTLLGARVSPRVRVGLAVAGYAVVGALATALALP